MENSWEMLDNGEKLNSERKRCCPHDAWKQNLYDKSFSYDYYENYETGGAILM